MHLQNASPHPTKQAARLFRHRSEHMLRDPIMVLSRQTQRIVSQLFLNHTLSHYVIMAKTIRPAAICEVTVPATIEGKPISKEREDYLKTIYNHQQNEAPVRTTTIARSLGVEPASVTGVIKRLAELGLLDYQPYKGVTLTEEGERVALEVIRHHRLIELYLIDALGYSWDEVHEEAERLEHAVSSLFIERIAKALGNPQIDPHGSPIPTEEGEIEPRAGIALDALHIGQGGQIARVDDDDPELLRYLGELGIRPGAEVAVLDIAPFGGPIRIHVSGTNQAIGPKAASHVYVRLHAP